MTLLLFMTIISATMVMGQRPQFAGSRPIGYPELYNRTTTTPDGLEDRFGEGTTQRLPIEANGDRDLIDRLSKLPIDKQPFWFINWQALEANRKNPQTYPQKPNVFIDPIPLSNQPISLNNSSGSNSQNLSNTGSSSQSSIGLSSRNGESNSLLNTASILQNNGTYNPQIPIRPNFNTGFSSQNSSNHMQILNDNFKQDSSSVGSTSQIRNANPQISTGYSNVNA